jgi:hypothetical protein
MTWAVFDDSHTRGIVEIIQSGSHRVTAIVGGSLLDAALDRTLSERLRKDKDIAGKLMKVGGALGNTGPKIDLLYLLNGLEKPTRNAIYGLSEVRNFFAHNLDASFESKKDKMVQAIEKLTLHEGLSHYPDHLAANRKTKTALEKIKNNRDRFLVNLRLCLIALMQDRVSHVPWSNTPLSYKKLRKTMKVAEACPNT